MQNQGKDNQGRPLEQTTRDGTSSAATLGTGATGDKQPGSSTDAGYDEAVRTPWNSSSPQPGRTDDLLSPGSAADQNGEGFVGGEGTQDISDKTSDRGSRTGAGPGNRQSDDPEREQSLSSGGRPSDPTGLQGAAGNQQAD